MNRPNTIVADPAAIVARDRLRVAANAVASRASAILGTRTTVWGGSQGGGVRSLTTGSENGDPLSTSRSAFISSWAEDATAAPLDLIQEAPSTVATSHVAPSIFDSTGPRQISRTATALTDPVTVQDDSAYSDDDDIEIELAQKYLSLGRQNVKQANLETAEKFFLKAVNTIQLLGSTNRVQLDERGIKAELAALYLRQDKLDSSASLCSEIIREALSGDADKKPLLNASHILAQINLRKGKFVEAKSDCKKAMLGRRRLEGKTEPYHESLALMVCICQHSGDAIDAESYEALLPVGYAKPEFKGPTVFAEASASSSLPEPAMPLETAPSPALTALSSRSEEPYTVTNQPNPISARSIPVRDRTTSQSSSTIQSSAPVNILVTSPMTPESPLTSGPPPAYELENPLVTPPSSYAGSPTEHRASIISQMSSRLPPPMVPVGQPHDPSPEYSTLERTADIPPSSRRPILFHTSSASSNDSHSTNRDERLGSPLMQAGTGQTTRRDRTYSSTSASLDLSSKATIWERVQPFSNSITMEQRETAVKSLEMGGFDIESKTFHSERALRWAAQNGQRSAALLLLSGWTLVNRKKKLGFKSTDTIVIGPADVHGFDTKGMTALHYASLHGHLEIATQLVAAKSPIHASTIQDSQTALHMAASEGHDGIVIMLCCNGAKTDARDNSGQTPFFLAVSRGQQRVADLLLNAGANLYHRDNRSFTALHHAARVPDDKIYILDYLIAKGASVRARDKSGRSAIHHAVHYNRLLTIKKLITLGGDPFSRDDDGDSILHQAAIEGHIDIIEYCITSLGFDINAINNKGETPLIVAAHWGVQMAVESLCAKGADVTKIDQSGLKASDHAAKTKVKAISVLLKRLEQDTARWPSELGS